MKRKRLLIALGAMVLLGAFCATCYVFYLKQQTAALLAARVRPESLKRYERIHEALNASVPGTPAPQPNQDWPPRLPEGDAASAELLAPLKQAEAVFTRVHEQIEAKGEWEAIYEDLFSRPFSQWSEADWARLNAYVKEHRDLLADIRAMAAAPGPLYPLDLSEGWATLLPHLAPTRVLARLLQAEAIALGHAGDFEGAAADIRAGLQLAARIQGEPLVISQLVSVAIDSLTLEGVSAAFPEGRIPPALAAELARHFHANPLSESIAESIETEEGIGLDFFTHIMESGWQDTDALAEVPEWTSPGWTGYLYTSPLARPWQNLDMQAYSQIMGEFGSTLGLPYYEAREALDTLEREIEELPATRLLTRNMLPSLISIHSAIAQAEARQQLFLVGTALESYASQNGAYPERLEAVQGQANGASIVDPFTGEPFHYSMIGNGFELYSVGRDLTDDGGRDDVRDGDIVWRGETAQKAAAVKVAGLK